MTLFYCPKCKKEEIRSDNPYKDEQTIINMRDGWGRPIQHYKCECGNYLAGAINFFDTDPNDQDFIEYCKETIEEYNPGGIYYDSVLSLSEDNKNFYEIAKAAYIKRKSQILSQKLNNLLEAYEKTKPKKPINMNIKGQYRCPCCNNRITKLCPTEAEVINSRESFCQNCGQAIDWKE